jgi:RND superfamily putative drug exporter
MCYVRLELFRDGINVNKVIGFMTGMRTSWVMILLGIIAAALTFGPLSVAKSETSPTSGVPAWAQSSQVTELQKDLPGADSTSAIALYQSDTRLTDDQKSFIADAQTRLMTFSPASGQFTPPPSFSKDGTTALIVVPLEKTDNSEKISKRVADMREVATSALPSGLKSFVTGPEGFQADIAGVFAGADITLLATTGMVVIVLLLITYRSPILWIFPLAVVGTADGMSSILATRIASSAGIQLDQSVTGILSILVFGAGTDYALLLISRYREELLRSKSRFDAMATALKAAGPAILASGVTVILALLTLLLADIEGTRALGIACATGVFVAMVAALTVLPAVLLLGGRWMFWPVVPKEGKVNKADTGLWAKLGRGVSKRPVRVAVAGGLILVALASGSLGLKTGLSSTEQFLKTPEAVAGQNVLADKFGAGIGNTSAVITNADKVDEVIDAAKSVSGVTDVVAGQTNDTITQVDVTIDAEPQSDEEYAVIQDLRDKLATVDGADALVGGLSATSYDAQLSYDRDQALIIPLILALVFIVLLVLLRSIVAPVLLLLTVVASYFASLGAGWLLFENVFHFPALAQSTFLFSFLFLVALGVDYNIFLVTRAQEESVSLGLREGMIKALSSTGGVITSAGILLAAVFAVLGVLPLIALTQIGIIVCIGVLLDTLLVRTVIVPALAFIAGEKFWWPRKSLAQSK